MVKKLLRNNKFVIEDFFSLLFVQFTNYLLPFITIPFLTRNLGIEGYGTFILNNTIALEMAIVINYGFNLTTVDELCKLDNIKDWENVFNKTIFAKLFIAIFLFFTGLIITYFFFKSSIVYFLLIFPFILGEVLMPYWYFQAKQKMKIFSFINAVPKFITIFLMFFFINEKRDIGIAIFFNALGYLISGIIGFLYWIKKDNIKVKVPNYVSLLDSYKNGFTVFISTFSVSIYSSFNTITLGAFYSNVEVGIYAVAEKVYKGLSQLAIPINRALYPDLIKKYKNARIEFERTIKWQILSILLMFFLISGLTYLFSKELVNILADNLSQKEESVAITCLNILSLAIIFRPFGAYFTQLFVIYDKKRKLFKIIVCTAVLNLFLGIPIIYLFSSMGVSISILISSIINFSISIYYLTFNDK